MRFDLLTLQLFIAVYEEQSIAKAAEREHIAASALSKRLSDLEESLKVTLFQRHRSGLEPTPAAHSLLHHARLVMRDLAQLESEIADFGKGLRGQVRLHANLWSIVQYLPEDLSAFLALHPMVRIDLEESISPSIVQAVAENAADIGILGANVLAPGLELIPYRKDKLTVVVPRGHYLAARESVKLNDIVDHELIGPRRGSALDALMLRAEHELNRSLKLRVRASGFETACRMVETNLGLTLVPEQAARRYTTIMAVDAVPLDESWAARELKLCVISLASLPPAARLLAEHLAAQ